MSRRPSRIARILAALLALLLLPHAGAVGAEVPLEELSPEALHNVLRAARAVNGCWVPRGSEFSFNNTLGPLTRAEGWLDAPDGTGGTRNGGGAEQVARALFLALTAQDAGAVFEELHETDGTVMVDAGTGLDLRFSTPETAVTLAVWIEDGALRCTVTPDAGEEPSAGRSAGSTMTPPDSPLIASASLALDGGEAAADNAILAADSVYDTTLRSGDIFSFNDIVGPRAERYGFTDAPDGRGEAVCGGGVGQLASVIWLAVKALPDFAILEKATYGGDYTQAYAASSADAILVDDGAGIDFAFRYTGPGSVTLFTYVQDDALCCDIHRQ